MSCLRKAKIFFFVLEIIINIICLIIIPKPDKYDYDYITKLYKKQFQNITEFENITYYYKEEEGLTKLKSISLVIIVVGSILCFFELERILLYFCYYKKKVIFAIISIFEIIFVLPVLISLWTLAITIIAKLDILMDTRISNRLSNETRGNIIGVIVQYSLTFIFLLLDFIFSCNFENNYFVLSENLFILCLTIAAKTNIIYQNVDINNTERQLIYEER